MMGYKEKLKGPDEYDAFTNWRYVLCWRSGERAKIKRRFRRRIRRRERQKWGIVHYYAKYLAVGGK